LHLLNPIWNPLTSPTSKVQQTFAANVCDSFFSQLSNKTPICFATFIAIIAETGVLVDHQKKRG